MKHSPDTNQLEKAYLPNTESVGQWVLMERMRIQSHDALEEVITIKITKNPAANLSS